MSAFSAEEAELALRIKQRCEEDQLFFTRYFFRHMSGYKFVVRPHHEAICEHLDAVQRGEIRNLLINMPPRYGKTELTVRQWPARMMALNPYCKFMHLAYSSELVLENSTALREIVKSPQFQSFWPMSLKRDADSKSNWSNHYGGGMIATQTGGAVTGFGAGILGAESFSGAIIIDDPLKPDDARHDLIRENINERLNTTIKSRRNSKSTPIIILMQRLHENDMSGFVLSGGMGEEFTHLKIPALQEDGTALWDMRHTAADLEYMRTHERNTFATQYQQEPTPEDGDVYRMSWFQRYVTAPPREDFEMVVHSWDTAYKKGTHADPSCCTVWGVKKNAVYLLDVIVAKMDYPELRKKLISLAERDKPNAVLIEDKASGQSLIQDLSNSTSLSIIAIKPEGDKETRARASSCNIEAGKVLLPEIAPWLLGYEKEVTLFPNSRHDDQVDSTSQFLTWWSTKKSGNNFLDELKALYG